MFADNRQTITQMECWAEMNECLQENLSEHKQAQLQTRRPVGLRRHLQRLVGALGLPKSKKEVLKSMFAAETTFVPVYNRVFQCELVFSFWGFVKNDETRVKLLDFLIWLMQPRMYMSAITKQGNHLEGLMIISLTRLHVQREVFESWLDLFFDTLQMSAGTLVFTEYLGEQMLSCMDRIQRSQKLRTNLFAEWNKDLQLLYDNLSNAREDRQRVLNVTGMPFTADNFIDMASDSTNRGSMRNAVHIRPHDWNWRILLRTMNQPHQVSSPNAAEEANFL
jgi:hypothetical protein